MAINLNSAVTSANSAVVSFKSPQANNAPAPTVVYVDQNGDPLPQAPVQQKPQQVVVENKMSFDLWETLKSAWPIVAGFVGLVLVGGAITAYHSGKSSGITDKQNLEHSSMLDKALSAHINTSEEFQKFLSQKSDLTNDQKEILLGQITQHIKDNNAFNIGGIQKGSEEKVREEIAKKITPLKINMAINLTQV